LELELENSVSFQVRPRNTRKQLVGRGTPCAPLDGGGARLVPSRSTPESDLGCEVFYQTVCRQKLLLRVGTTRAPILCISWFSSSSVTGRGSFAAIQFSQSWTKAAPLVLCICAATTALVLHCQSRSVTLSPGRTNAAGWRWQSRPKLMLNGLA